MEGQCSGRTANTCGQSLTADTDGSGYSEIGSSMLAGLLKVQGKSVCMLSQTEASLSDRRYFAHIKDR